MTTTARIGIGAQVWLGSAGTPTTPVQLGEITSVPLPNPQTADVEATHFGSPNRRREYIAGLIEDGEGTIGMNYDPNSATDVICRAAQNDGIARSYKIVIPDGSATWEITGTCIVKGYERSVPIDDRMTANLSIRFTGASTEAAGA
jgi:predicted secreted protein